MRQSIHEPDNKRILYSIKYVGEDGRVTPTYHKVSWSERAIDKQFQTLKSKQLYFKHEHIVDCAVTKANALAKLTEVDKLLLGIEYL